MLRLVINLDSSTDRLEWVSNEFARLGLSFQRFAAIGRDDLCDELMDAVARPNVHKHRWAPAEIACFLSHRECWRIAAASGQSHVAIFEDDIHLAPDAAIFLRDGSWIPRGIDLIKLETMLQRVRVRARGIPVGNHLLYELRSLHWGSAGYIVTPAAARSLLNASKTFDRTVDAFIFDPTRPGRTVRSHQLSPAICIQDFIVHAEITPMTTIIGFDRAAARSIPLPETRPTPPRSARKALSDAALQLRALPARLRRLASGPGRRIDIPFAHASITWATIRRARERRIESDTPSTPDG